MKPVLQPTGVCGVRLSYNYLLTKLWTNVIRVPAYVASIATLILPQKINKSTIIRAFFISIVLKSLSADEILWHFSDWHSWDTRTRSESTSRSPRRLRYQHFDQALIATRSIVCRSRTNATCRRPTSFLEQDRIQQHAITVDHVHLSRSLTTTRRLALCVRKVRLTCSIIITVPFQRCMRTMEYNSSGSYDIHFAPFSHKGQGSHRHMLTS